MSTFNGTPIPLGQIQTSYSDQMATAFAGQLMSASDVDLTDSVLVSSAGNISCGLGVIATITNTGTRAGINDTQISLPTSSNVAADFAGVVVRPFSAFSSGASIAEAKASYGAMILDPKRVGGRIWVKCNKGASAGGTVYWRVGSAVVLDQTPVGSFCGLAISGTVPAVYASGTATFSANPADGETLTIGSQAYRFKTTMAAANDIQLAGTLTSTLTNLVAVIDGTATLGTTASGANGYTGTTQPNAAATAVVNGSVVTVQAVTAGTSGNSTTFTKSSTAITVSGSGTLAGGAAATTATDTVALTNAIWKTTATDGQIAKLQIGQ